MFEGPLISIEKSLAGKVGMEEGKFYCFYRQQLVAQNCESLIHQLLMKSCDTFVPHADAEARLSIAIQENGNYLTKAVAAELFDSLFDRTSNVQFIAGNRNQFRQSLKSKDESERPQVFLEYAKSSASEAFIKEILEYL